MLEAFFQEFVSMQIENNAQEAPLFLAAY